MRILHLLALVATFPAAQVSAQEKPPRVALISEYTFVFGIIPPQNTGFPAAAAVGPLVYVGGRNGLGWVATLDLTHSTPYLGTGPRVRR